ncbi:TonB-dependent receptor [Qipengyuania sp.]|uniref:TonB-dependent receptor n=1 Tax=Qipengyuania sp. TaxID=2004515 RepID=UPI003BA8D2D5
MSKIRHSALAVPFAIMASTAPAQPVPADRPPPEEERNGASEPDGPEGAVQAFNTIVVTGTKRRDGEAVQDVALAVTALDADTLDALNVTDITSLSYSAPNVALEDVGTSKGAANFSIRGLGINSSIPSIDPTVGVFVDGIYIGINNGLVLDTFDLQSAEILRGPQGILFGRNTTGGAVLLNTSDPTDYWSGEVRASLEGPVDAGRGGPSTTVHGILSGPIVNDLLSFKIAGYFNDDQGYFVNTVDGSNLGASETSILRAALRFTPSNALTLVAKYERLETDADGPAAVNHALTRRGDFDIAIDEPGLFASDSELVSVRLDWDVGNGTITNIFGYRDFTQDTVGDIDATPLFLFHSDSELAQDQISNELRYSGEFGPVIFGAGLYYFQQDIASTERRQLPTITPAEFNGGGRQDHEVYGAFMQVDWEVVPDLKLIAGIRYSEESKDVAVIYVRPRPRCSVVDGTCPATGTNPFVPGEPNGFADDDSWSNWTPKLGIQYFTGDSQFYATYSRGVRSGGYNFRVTTPAAFLAQVAATGAFSFDEEKVDAYEVGAKIQAFDRRLTLNSAIFLTNISDMQREVNFASATAGVAQSILNTADAQILGLEFEGRFSVTNTLLFTANLGILDAEYEDVRFDISGDGVVTQADLDLALPRVPEATYGFGLIHDLDLGRAGTLVTTANFQHRDRVAFTDSNLGWVSASDQLDANVTWATPITGLELSIFGKNLLDEAISHNDTQTPFPGPLSTGVAVPFGQFPAAGTFSPIAEGRRLGVEARYAF